MQLSFWDETEVLAMLISELCGIFPDACKAAQVKPPKKKKRWTISTTETNFFTSNTFEGNWKGELSEKKFFYNFLSKKYLQNFKKLELGKTVQQTCVCHISQAKVEKDLIKAC